MLRRQTEIGGVPREITQRCQIRRGMAIIEPVNGTVTFWLMSKYECKFAIGLSSKMTAQGAEFLPKP